MSLVNADALFPLQQALYTALDAALDADVYDDVPEGASYPYVVVGEFTEIPENAHDRFGARITATLHVWSSYHGTKDALAIRSSIVEELDHQAITVAGFDTIAARHEQTIVIRDPDEDLRHIAVRFSFVTEKTPS